MIELEKLRDRLTITQVTPITPHTRSQSCRGRARQRLLSPNSRAREPRDRLPPQLSFGKGADSAGRQVTVISRPQALPAVASISAVRPFLYSLRTTSELFYTKKNAWQLREGHEDPFTNETLRFLPQELPRIQMPTCAVKLPSCPVLDRVGWSTT